MFSFLGQTWRRIVQLFSFALFGLGAWVLATAIFPLLWIAPVTAERKTTFIQKVVHRLFRLFLWFVEACRGMEFCFEGANFLSKTGPGLVIANHPTLLDVVILISRLPQADCVVKKELWNNFFLRRIVMSAGYIPNDDGPELVAAAIERIRKGRKVIIFPEGTRSLPGGLRPFNKGFAHIAVKAPCLLWPVVITCHPSALRKAQSVFDVPARRARLTATAGKPLNPADYYSGGDSGPIAVRKVADALRNYFEERTDYGEFENA